MANYELPYIRSIEVLNDINRYEKVSKEDIQKAVEIDTKRLENFKEKLEKKDTYHLALEISKKYYQIVATDEWETLLKLHFKLSKVPALICAMDEGWYLDSELLEALSKLDDSSVENIVMKRICKEMKANKYYSFYEEFYSFTKQNKKILETIKWVKDAEEAIEELNKRVCYFDDHKKRKKKK